MSGKSASSRDISVGNLSQDQETIILELEAILSTVKQIDSNVTKSIELLQQPFPAGRDAANKSSSQKVLELNYQEVILKNTELVSGIIESLKSLR